ncbi:MAG: 2-amino-4-hydroxy-6-hydroxymethyldihydropteridine diphosphokinase [Actinomycetota bacterium]|nr:2-amino-4-hydroxy-6-hydroxymethyldihydropteridine diphosphokinase [Actinomycetota bacterium]
MVRAAIGLGSNLGDRAGHIADAVAALVDTGSLIRVSSLYETAPVGGPKQGQYLNAVAIVDTDLSVRDLLERCLAIEKEHGRERRERWGPRTLDLDILLYGDLEVAEPDLSVPHPRMVERLFVLEPLLEAWPDATLPGGIPLASYLPGLSDQKVRRLETLVPDRMTSALLFLVVAAGALAIWWIADWLF